jgi:hypothetical protein
MRDRLNALSLDPSAIISESTTFTLHGSLAKAAPLFGQSSHREILPRLTCRNRERRLRPSDRLLEEAGVASANLVNTTNKLECL